MPKKARYPATRAPAAPAPAAPAPAAPAPAAPAPAAPAPAVPPVGKARRKGRAAPVRKRIAALQLFLLARAAPPTGQAGATADAPQGTWLPVRTEGTLRLGTPDAAGQVTVQWSLEASAMKWSEVLRNRARWAGNSTTENEQRRDARHTLLAMLGHGDDPDGAAALETLKALADAEMIEVQVPYRAEGTHWEYRVFPWEFILAEATREQRRDGRLLVLRHLDDGRATSAGGTQLLHVESVPSVLRKLYDFSGEAQLLKSIADDEFLRYSPLIDADAETLRRIATQVPNAHLDEVPRVIHVSGFDVHQGRDLLGPGHFDRPGTFDGLLMRGQHGAPWEVLDGEALAAHLVGPRQVPSLVCINTYNSAARMAAMCVAHGARAAIGFQDTFEDDLAELFFSALYRGCLAAGWHDLPAAFRYAWSIVHEQQRPLLGAGVVLWSRSSIADTRPAALAQLRTRVEQGLGPDDAPLHATAATAGTAAGDRPPAPRPVAEIARSLDVVVKPLRELNYSILHNEGALFERFTIRKPQADIGAIEGIEILVELHAGEGLLPFRTRTSIDTHTPMREFAQDIKVPLTSTLGRAQRENVRTSLYVRVSLHAPEGEVLLHEHTYRVTLLSVDEWRDDDTNRIWLPSFVQPRDPAVLRVIDSAQRYLMALRDDPSAGFDGYQCVEYATPRPDPFSDCALVDRQVQAIWAALLYEHPLSYINPPPTFSDASQRLRTPSDVIDGRRGTCIDLALLLASCLEYVDIHAGIVLLKAHAFPVYWRHSSYLEDFRVGVNAGEDDAKPTSRGKQQASWSIGAAEYRAIKREVDQGRLVPIETVMLTQRVGFVDAIDEGLANFRTKREFDSLLDITIARTDRTRSVTPLPVRREDAR